MLCILVHVVGYTCKEEGCSVHCKTWSEIRKHVVDCHKISKYQFNLLNDINLHVLIVAFCLQLLFCVLHVTGLKKKSELWQIFMLNWYLSAYRITEAESIMISEHSCKTCGKQFVSGNQYRAHVKIHSKQRDSVPCPHPDCHRVYLDQRNLNIHLKVVHQGGSFKCSHDGCDVVLISKVTVATFYSYLMLKGS